MRIDGDFTTISALQLKVRAQARRIEELESGGAYAAEVARRKSLQRDYESQVGSLRREVADLGRLNAKMVRGWWETCELVRREGEEAVAHAVATARAQEERALRAERDRDGLAAEVTALNRRVRELEAENEELRGMNSKLTAQVRRDFENSSVPSSKQVARRKQVPNTRAASGRPRGAQPGHPHHPRRRPEPTATVALPDPEGWDDDPDLYRTGETIGKVVVSARVVVEATEYVANVWRSRATGGRRHAPFPDGVSDEVTYDGSCKALAFLLNNECCASIPKTSRFLSEASGGALGMSAGMICGLAREFSGKSAPERRTALESLMSSPVMHADFTCANVGGDAAQVLILANGEATAMYARERKGHDGVAGTPLADYVGCVSHDHDRTFYSYGTSHQECLQHAIRYLVGSTQNEPHLTWNARMLEHVRAMIHWRNSLAPGAPPDPAEVEAMERRYDEVLGLAEAEYAEHPPTKYYRDGYNLFRRMRDFREHHLLFLHDTRVEPDNSLCERKARVFKRRQHAAMAFRSFENLGNVCDGIAAVDNMRVAGKDVFAETCAIFGRNKAAQAASS